MNYEKIDMGAYNLHLIKTEKFKTITVDISFRRKIKKEEITIRNLLKEVLLNSNSIFTSENELIKETENLYDLKLVVGNSRVGNYINTSFKTRFLNEKYTEKNMNYESIIFLLNIILKPNILDNKFNKKIVDTCKDKLKNSIISLKDNKLKYALIKLFESTKDKPYSYNSYGYIEDTDKITVSDLYNYYLSILKEDIIDIFVVGDIDSKQIKDIFKENFNIKTFHKRKDDILVSELESIKEIKKYKEKDDVNQTQLTILCSLKNLTDFERRYVIKIYNEILGGSSNSILFNTVREKNSYAYYVNSSDKPYDNILFIYAGIETGNDDKVLSLIKESLKNIENGEFSDNLISSSKETIIGSIEASLDAPMGIVNNYFSKELINTLSPEERIKKINSVNKKDIIELAKKIKIHTIFTLEGDTNENN